MTVPGRSPRPTGSASSRPDAGGGDEVGCLIACWLRDAVPFVVLDLSGRHRHDLPSGRLDLSWPSVLRPLDIDVELRRHGYAVLDAGELRQFRRAVLNEALAALRACRAAGRAPAWILVEDLDSLPGGLLPDAKALDAGAWALAAGARQSTRGSRSPGAPHGGGRTGG